MTSENDGLRGDTGSDNDPKVIFDLAQQLESTGHYHLAATAYDRAFGLDDSNEALADARRRLLKRLAVTEHGIRFVYIPAGTYLMGSETGEPDERPVHSVELGHYWLSDTPVSWSAYCRILGWQPPPQGLPEGFDWKKIPKGDPITYVPGLNKIRLQYCENETAQARDWHAHVPDTEWKRGDGTAVTSREMFGEVTREDANQPLGYDHKPMIAVTLEGIALLCGKISTSGVSYRLPTEAEWEKGARGGLINKFFPWGNALPDAGNCDFGRFEKFSIQPMRRFSPNGYGLYAMSGGVWEWVSDWYDAEYYSGSAQLNPTGPQDGVEKVVRGGSWSDCAEVQTVSFRGTCAPETCRNPNIGFRLCRVETPQAHVPEEDTFGWKAKLRWLFSGAGGK